MKIFVKKYTLSSLLSASIAFVPTLAVLAQTIDNPLKSSDVKVILVDIMNLVATVGAVVVVFFIIYSGYKFVSARGNEAEVTKAKDIFFATIIGGAILLGADVIANVVINTVNTTVGKTP
jgi:hypothetical protein